MLGRGPLVFLTGAAPRLHKPPVLIELQNRRRGNAAQRGRRIQCRRSLSFSNGGGTMKNPDVILVVDADAADLSGRPPVWQVLKEQGIDLEIRNARRLLRRRDAFDDDERCAGQHQQDQSARDLEDLPQHGVHRATILRMSVQVKASAAGHALNFRAGSRHGHATFCLLSWQNMSRSR